MSTNSAVAVRNEDGTIRGRYVHWDGDSVGDTVKALIKRDGMEKVVKTIIFDHHGWSSLDERPGHDVLSDYYPEDRFKAVPGYGVAYQPTEHPDEWIKEIGDWGTEYVHIIETDGTITTISD